MNEEEHIGDGVYISVTGEGVKLRTPRPSGDHEIWLDHYTISRMQEYMRDRKLIP